MSAALAQACGEATSWPEAAIAIVLIVVVGICFVAFMWVIGR